MWFVNFYHYFEKDVLLVITIYTMTNQEAIKVIDLALELITAQSKWTKDGEFDEECSIAADAFTLSCAVKLMQISVTGKFESRNLVMRKLRNKIRWHFFWRQGFHPIHSFNKHKKTTYEDVIFVLNKVRGSLM